MIFFIIILNIVVFGSKFFAAFVMKVANSRFAAAKAKLSSWRPSWKFWESVPKLATGLFGYAAAAPLLATAKISTSLFRFIGGFWKIVLVIDIIYILFLLITAVLRRRRIRKIVREEKREARDSSDMSAF